jgi:hypothetical protein
MHKIIDLVRNCSGALVGAAVDPLEFSNCFFDLLEKNITAIPAPLEEFYKLANGISYDGNEIYSIGFKATHDPDSGYSLKDIYAANLDFHYYYKRAAGYKSSFLLFGNADEERFIFDLETGKYLIAAREDLMIYESFDDFTDFLNYLFGSLHP